VADEPLPEVVPEELVAAPVEEERRPEVELEELELELRRPVVVAEAAEEVEALEPEVVEVAGHLLEDP